MDSWMGEYFLFEKEFFMRIRVLLVLLGLLSFVILSPAPSSYAAQRCFTETNQCMDGRIAEFWEQNGGLAVFGFPIGPQELVLIDGKSFTVQRFERNRLELHPENARPYDVLLGRLGADRLGQQGRDWFAFAKSGDTGGCRVFAETGHAVCGSILKAWRANGLQIDGKKAVSEAESLALFGMPLSGLMTETLSDGKQYQVQWFERARFELHPENTAPYDVLLGLLGNEVQPLQRDTIYDVKTIGPLITLYPLSSKTFDIQLKSARFEGKVSNDGTSPSPGNVFVIAEFSFYNRGPSNISIQNYVFEVMYEDRTILSQRFIPRAQSCYFSGILRSSETATGCVSFEVKDNVPFKIIFAPYASNKYIDSRFLEWPVRR
jgi:hypothetical protein